MKFLVFLLITLVILAVLAGIFCLTWWAWWLVVADTQKALGLNIITWFLTTSISFNKSRN